MESSGENNTQEIDGRNTTASRIQPTRIIKMINQVTEHLEETDVRKIHKAIKLIAKEEATDQTLEEVIDDFTELTMFKRGISVNLMKQVIRCFMLMKRRKDLAKSVLQIANTMFSKVITSLEAEYGPLDEETLRLYFDALRDGIEKVRHIRLMVVGMFGVGKTSLIRNMCHGNLDDVKSTVGIDVSVNACEVDDNKQWKITNGEEKAEKYYKWRINNAMKHKKEKEGPPTNTTSSQSETQSRPIHNDEESTSVENDEETKTAALENKNIDSFPEDMLMDEPGGNEAYYVPDDFDQHRTNFQSVVNKNEEVLKDLSAVQENDEPEKRITTVSIWDFAGQSIYYSTHHFFLSTRSIYLLVIDLSKSLYERVPEDNLSGNSTEEQATSMPPGFTYLDAFKFWMNSIYTYTHRRTDDSDIEYRPTIVLVGTFRDKVDVANPKEHMEDYFEQALKSFQDTEIVKLVHDKKFFLHKNDSKENFDELKREISDIAENQPFWNEEVPAQWIPLERSIEARKGKSTDENSQHGNDVMDMGEVVDNDKGTELPLLDKKKMKLFLKFQHVLGNVLYFDADQLDQKIILNPQWILDVFKLFVRHVDIPKKPEHGKLRQEYKDNAILRPELISHLIKHSGNPTFEEYQTEIIRYMEHLDIMAKPLRYPDECSDTDSDTDTSDDEDEGSQSKGKGENTAENFYYVPCLMTKLPPSVESLAVNNSTPTLCLVFKHKFLPAFVFHRLLATCITKWEIYSHQHKTFLYKGFGRFYLNSSRLSFLTIWYKDHIIYMMISAHDENVLDDEECTEVKTWIEAMIQRIFRIHVKCAMNVMDKDNLQYDEYIFCPKCEKDAQEGDNDTDTDSDIVKRFIEISRLEKNQKVACPSNHSHESEKLLCLWFSDDTETRKCEEIGKERKKLISWIKTNKNVDRIDESHFAELSCHIGREYVALGIELDISLAKIDQLILTHSDVQTRIKAMLNGWWKGDSNASVKSLITALYKVLGYNDGEGKSEKGYTRQDLLNWFPTRDMNSTPEDKELGEIARYIGKKYRRLANILKFPSAKMDHIEEEQKFSYDRALMILKAWRDENTKNTFKALKRKIGKVLYIDFEC